MKRPVLLLCAVAFFVPAASVLAGKGPITRLQLDPDARVLPLFDGIKDKTFEARVVAHNQYKAHVYLTNNAPQTMTVALPKTAGAVQVLKQALSDLDGFAEDTQQGDAQPIGGQFGAQNGFPQGNLNNQFNNGPFGPGQNFFSIPPEKTVQLDLHCVCLEHGSPNPRKSMAYQLVPIERIAPRNAALAQLLSDYTPRTSSRKSLQAAAWHLADGLTWKGLRRKTQDRIGLRARRYFTKKQLAHAKELVEKAEEAAKKSDEASRAEVAETRTSD